MQSFRTINTPIIKIYFNSSNILLDENFVSKISDFGMAIDLPKVVENRTLVTAFIIARTEVYFPPEATSRKFLPRMMSSVMVW